jgi:large subunit ribosomal protein L35
MPRAYRGGKIKKLKSNSGAAKRFRRTGSAKKGKIGFKATSAKRRHQMTCKTQKMKRHARSGLRVRAEDLGRIEQMLPFA